MKQKPKELDIHTEVVKIFWAELSCYPTEREVKTMKKIEKLIKKCLTQQRTELLEEIKKIVEEQLFWYEGEDYSSITAREALNQVKNLLNKKDAK